jgi:hypothetical protein
MPRLETLRPTFKVDLKAMSNGPIALINRRERRRRWSVQQKVRIVAEMHEPPTLSRPKFYGVPLHLWGKVIGVASVGVTP